MYADLIERLERAEGDDEEIFLRVAQAILPRSDGEDVKAARESDLWWYGYGQKLKCGAYESAALSLVERKLPGASVLMGLRQTDATRPWARVGPWREEDATAATLALAQVLLQDWVE